MPTLLAAGPGLNAWHCICSPKHCQEYPYGSTAKCGPNTPTPSTSFPSSRPIFPHTALITETVMLSAFYNVPAADSVNECRVRFFQTEVKELKEQSNSRHDMPYLFICLNKHKPKRSLCISFLVLLKHELDLSGRPGRR